MNVSSICSRKAITVRRTDELVRAAQLMREQHIGYLVVVEPDTGNGLLHPVGVLTDRDIVITVVAREADPRTLRVADVMTQPPVTVNTADSMDQALHKMRRFGVRRLPVIDKHREVVGILSLDDVLGALASQMQNVAGSIRNEQLIEGTLRP